MRRLYLVLLMICNTCFADIIKTNDVNVIADKISQYADINSLIIFDMHDVLVRANDKILQPNNKETYNKFIQQLKDAFDTQTVNEMNSIIWMYHKNAPVDIGIVKFISNLQKNKIGVVVLTHCPTGRLGVIPNVEDWSIHNLSQNGYNFKKSWINIENNSLKKFLNANNNSNPLFKDGIIFTDKIKNKGIILEAFLKYSKLHPKKIALIDDNRWNLNDVEKFAKDNHIEFLGIEYTKAHESTEPLNFDIANKQFEILTQERKWLSDKEVVSLKKN